jgi:inhibitor of KinA
MLPQFTPMGDSAVRVRMGEQPSLELFRSIRAFCDGLRRAQLTAVVEFVPALTTVTVYYRPHLSDYARMCRHLAEIRQAPADSAPQVSETIVLPVCYGDEFGPDMEFVACHHGLMVEQVIARHSAQDYLVYMMGFAPGFPYLWGMPDSLATPRLDTPRLAVPAGSVGIGGTQTGVYSIQTPGGWRIIGHTPVRLFDVARDQPFLMATGDWVRFEPITHDEHARIRSEAAAGRYAARRIPRQEPTP